MASSTFGSSGPNSSTTAALWGHLLHKKPHTALAANLKSSSEDLVPPMRPVDKAATSVRMLLHDTQAVLEKFSGRVDKLHGEIEDAKREVATSHKVFQHGHEKLLLEQVDLVNRCQTQLQKSLGKPAQTSSMDEVLRDVQSTNRRLEGLDRRVDALHMVCCLVSECLAT
ncbi:hypothetical protein BC835DRAFT_1281296 [Cytidiella melzeri]|nr:hypothetical protein BC835DRAFT_1281296 [Cytidiella melzeri]